MNAKSMKHLANCRDLTFQKNRDGPSVVVGHVVEEPAACGSGTVELQINKSYSVKFDVVN